MSLDKMIAAEEKETSVPDEEPRSIPDEGSGYLSDNGVEPVIDNEVSAEKRAQLAALSDSFVPHLITKSEPLPFPDAITNTKTEFLALDKCEPNREFLQLLEVSAISDPPPQKLKNRPFGLQYDPEWLAITRVFAPDLELGGNATKTVAPDRGETYYRERIAEEAEWVDKHIVMKGLLDIPEIFTTTAPVYDAGLRVDSSEMPREYTNPQTSEFCRLLGIENRFDISEEERGARRARGPRPDASHHDIRGGRHEGRIRGGRGGRFTNSNRGGGRGGGRGDRGGRGHGRGRW
jgi:lariat debranching enzyme